MTQESQMTPRQAALRLGQHLSYVYQLLYAGKLAGTMRDGRWEIPAEAVEARLKAREARQGGSRR